MGIKQKLSLLFDCYVCEKEEFLLRGLYISVTTHGGAQHYVCRDCAIEQYGTERIEQLFASKPATL